MTMDIKVDFGSRYTFQIIFASQNNTLLFYHIITILFNSLNIF